MNEITYAAGISLSKPGNSVSVGFGGTVNADWSGDNYVTGTLDLTTSYEYIPMGDVTSPCMCYLENLGSNPIEVKDNLTGAGLLKLKPGFRNLISLGPGFGTPAVKSSTGTSRIKYLIAQE